MNVHPTGRMTAGAGACAHVPESTSTNEQAPTHTSTSRPQEIDHQTRESYRMAGNSARLNFDAVRRAATGRWPAALVALGIDAAFLRDRHGPCPGCGGSDRFRFDDRDGRGTWLCSGGGGAPLAGDGFELLRHVHGWSAAESLRAAADALGLTSGRSLPPVHQPVPAAPDPAAVARTRDSLNRLWLAALPLDHDDAEPARRYFDARGLAPLVERGDLPADVRLHPACPYWIAGPDGRPVRIAELPALLGLVRSPTGEAAGLHQTWLHADGSGKARLTDPAGTPLDARKLRTIRPGASRGAAIRLYPPGERLAIGEGIETVLACRVAAPSLPVWAGISAGNLPRVAVELRARYPGADLVLLADDDPAGRTACERAARAVDGRVALPPEVRHGA